MLVKSGKQQSFIRTRLLPLNSSVRHTLKMNSIESLIQSSQKLTAFFGGWPSFHDAEVVDLHFWRGDIKQGDWDDSNIFPVLTIKVHVLEATQQSATHAGNDILATLRFHDVNDFKMEGFNHQNAILSFPSPFRSADNLRAARPCLLIW